MNQAHKITSLFLLTLFASATKADCCDHKQKEHKFYIGAEYGLSTPLKKEFTHKETKMTGKLSNASIYGGRIGYKFYEGMAIEAGWQHKPVYKLKFILPEFKAQDIFPQTKTPGKTKITTDTYTLGLIYDLQNLGSFTPYVGIDAGVARIKSKFVSVYKDIITPMMTFPDQEIFRIRKATTFAPTMQLTIGISTPEIIPNLRVNLAGRLQIIKDARIKYQKYNGTSGQWENKSLKQTLGVGEIVLGLTYYLF